MSDAIESYCPDLLWKLAEPFLPEAPRPEQGGGKRRVHPDRAILAAVVYKGKTGCAWADVPRSAFGAPKSTLHERFATWVRSGFFEALLAAIHNELGAAEAIGWHRAAIDSVYLRAKRGGEHVGPSPVDRGKPGSKIHLIADEAGLPLAVEISAANVHDKRLLEHLVDKIGPIRGRKGWPRRRPDKLHGDKGYDYTDCRAALRRRGIIHRIARKGIESSQRLGRHRWKVERTIAWLDGFRALGLRYERKAAHFLAFVTLGAAMTCYKALAKQANNPIPDELLMVTIVWSSIRMARTERRPMCARFCIIVFSPALCAGWLAMGAWPGPSLAWSFAYGQSLGSRFTATLRGRESALVVRPVTRVWTIGAVEATAHCLAPG